MDELATQMTPSASSLNYITLLFGITRLLVAFYAFVLMGIKRQRSIYLPFQGYQRAFIFFLGLWELSKAIQFLYPGTAWLPRLYAWGYIAVPFTSLTYFYFCFSYTFPQKIHLMKYLLWLMVVPLVTVTLTLVPFYNKYFIVFTSEIIYLPYRDITMIYQSWFYVHSVYSYLLVLIGIFFLIIKLKYPANQNRKFCIYAIIATIVFIMQNVYLTFIKADGAIWFIPIMSTTVITFFFLIVYADEGEIIVSKGQEKLMKAMVFPVFFLNKDENIVYANEEAFKICPNIYKDFEFTDSLQDIMKNFSPYHIDTKIAQNELFSGESNIILQSKANGDIFYLHKQEISLKGKKHHDETGTLLMFVAISSMQNFFSILEDKAFKDPLCGCYNRHFLEIKQAEFSVESDAVRKLLPISFVMCDIDGLKVVNDTHGHDKGNEYITLCHDIIRSSVHGDDFIFRLGGDEFLIILTNTEQQVAQERVVSIEAKMQEIKKEYNTSISIGSATAEEIPIDYLQLISDADEEMYRKKRQRSTNTPKV